MQILKRNTLQLALTLIMAVFLSACAVQPVQPAATGGETTTTEATTSEATSEETVTISHPQGETTVVKNPQTVVVFEYGILNTLDILDIPVAAVTQGTAIPALLSKYADPNAYANAGTLFEPDYEKINELKPDLIIVGGRSAATLPELSKIGPTIDVTINQETFVEDFKRNMTNIGLIFGREEEIATTLAEIEESIARVQEKAAASGKTALILSTSGGEITAYGPGSRYALIHDILGVTPIVEDIEAATHGDVISFEFVLEHDPDIIYVIDRDSSIGESSTTAQQILDNELIHATKAYQNDNIVYLDSPIWYLANTGLGTVPSMIAEIEASLE